MQLKPFHLFIAGALLLAAGYLWLKKIRKDEEEEEEVVEEKPKRERKEPKPEPEAIKEEPVIPSSDESTT
jgi:hypothetical protein